MGENAQNQYPIKPTLKISFKPTTTRVIVCTQALMNTHVQVSPFQGKNGKDMTVTQKQFCCIL